MSGFKKNRRITPSPIPPRFRHHVFFLVCIALDQSRYVQWTKRDNSNTSRTDRVHVGEGTIWYCFYNCGEDAQSCPPPHQLSWNKPPHNTLFHIEWIKSRLSIKNREPNCCEGPLDWRQHFNPGGFNCVSVQYDKTTARHIDEIPLAFSIHLTIQGSPLFVWIFIDYSFVVLNNHVVSIKTIKRY